MRRSRHARWLVCALALVTIATTATPITNAAAAPTGEETWGKGFEANRDRVPFKGKVKVRGVFRERFARTTVSDGGVEAAGTDYGTRPVSGERVRIEYKVAGAKSWKTIKQTRTGKRGRFKKGLRIGRSGYVRARLADGTTTAKRKVRVRSRLISSVRRRHIDAGSRTKIVGHVKPGTRGRRVVVKVGPQKVRTRTGRGGRFKVSVRLGSTGTRKVSVHSRSDKAATGAKSKAGRVTAYRRAMASWYGPGFYGNRTACGSVLGYDTVGVAHRTLPCGTKLTFRLGKRTVRARVIDRGPYHSGREFDLTGALKRKLGFGSTGYVQVDR